MRFVFFLHTSYVLLSSFPVGNQWNVLLKLVNVQRKNTPELMNDGIQCELIVPALQRYGSCVNTLGIARGQSHSNFMLFQLETLLIGLFISWGDQPFSGVEIHRIQRIHWVHITVYILFDNIRLHVISNLCSMSRKYLIFPEKFPRFPDFRQNLQIPGINLFFSRNSPCQSCHPPCILSYSIVRA